MVRAGHRPWTPWVGVARTRRGLVALSIARRFVVFGSFGFVSCSVFVRKQALYGREIEWQRREDTEIRNGPPAQFLPEWVSNRTFLQFEANERMRRLDVTTLLLCLREYRVYNITHVTTIRRILFQPSASLPCCYVPDESQKEDQRWKRDTIIDGNGFVYRSESFIPSLVTDRRTWFLSSFTGCAIITHCRETNASNLFIRQFPSHSNFLFYLECNYPSKYIFIIDQILFWYSILIPILNRVFIIQAINIYVSYFVQTRRVFP